MPRLSTKGSGEIEATRAPRPSDAVPVDPGDQEVSTQHQLAPGHVGADWLDRLLAAVAELPLADGELASVAAMIDALATILPDHAVGACFVPDPGGPSVKPEIVKRRPAAIPERPAGVDPTRLFPDLASEHVVRFAGSAGGSTLHVATDCDDFDSGLSREASLVDRAASILGRLLPHARRVALSIEGEREIRALDQRMIQADKLATFGQMAAGIVHELNNPLTSIVAYSDYLVRKAIAAGEARDAEDLERLRRINDSANRMLRFTRHFVAYARPSTGAAGPVVLHSVIDQAASFCEHVLAQAGMQVERRYSPDVRAVRGVDEQLVQVFVNLFTNASHAGPERDGRIVVTTALDPATGLVTVTVADNGSGILAEHLPRVFMPFFTTKAAGHGTGLGLSIVKTILDDHEGLIRVESRPGAGATFEMVLPVWAPTPPAPAK